MYIHRGLKHVPRGTMHNLQKLEIATPWGSLIREQETGRTKVLNRVDESHRQGKHLNTTLWRIPSTPRARNQQTLSMQQSTSEQSLPLGEEEGKQPSRKREETWGKPEGF